MTDLTAKGVIAMAIESEEAAAAFYRKVADIQSQRQLKELFLGFAREEDRHKERLLALDVAECGKIEPKKIADLGIAETLTPIEPTDRLDYADALVIGMKREKEAYLFYARLVQTTADPALQKLFTLLAQEEAAHKLWFETEYDEYVLREN